MKYQKSVNWPSVKLQPETSVRTEKYKTNNPAVPEIPSDVGPKSVPALSTLIAFSLGSFLTRFSRQFLFLLHPVQASHLEDRLQLRSLDDLLFQK